LIKKGKDSGDFVLVSEIGGGPVKYNKARMIIAPILAILMISLAAADVLDLLPLALAAAFMMIFIGCLTIPQAIKATNLRVIIMIAASFAMASALEVTGVANEWAHNLVSLFGSSQWGLLYAVYVATALLTALLSNASAAALMLPIVFELSLSGGAPLLGIKALLVCIMVAASADFSTPIGYQTNLMAWVPGGYHFTDYARIGLPLQVLLSLVSTTIIYFVFGTKGGPAILKAVSGAC